MNGKTHILMIAFVGLIMSVLAAPGLISYQGRILDNTGKPVISAVEVTFTFWDAETNGNQLGSGFSDMDTVSPDADGVYSTMIGDDPGNLVPAAVFTGDSVWLNVNVGGEDLSPRKRITSVGYAMQSGGAAEVKKVIRDFVVTTGKSVDAGDVVTFLPGVIAKHDAPEEISRSNFNKRETLLTGTARLTDTSFVIAYEDFDGSFSFHGTVDIGTITGRTIRWLGPSVFSEGQMVDLSVASLSSTKFVVAYQNNEKKGIARIGTISGGSVSWGPEFVFNDVGTFHISVAALNEKEFIVTYRDDGDSCHGNSRKGTVSLSSISWGDEYTFNEESTLLTKIIRLTGNRFVVAFNIFEKSFVAIGEDSGETIDYGPAWEFFPVRIDEMSLTALSEKTIVVAYRYSNGLIRVGKIAGMKVSWGDDVLFNQGLTYRISIAGLSDSQYVVAYSNNVNNNYGEMRLGTVSGNHTAIGPKTVFNSEDTQYISAQGLTPENFIIGFLNDGTTKFGTALLGKSYGTVIGIADAAGSGGSSVPVILDGISDHHTGLKTGKMYYAGEDGTLTDDYNAPQIGKALSNKELLLDIPR